MGFLYVLSYLCLSNFTRRLLDKAAVKSGPTSSWILCPVTQVEETKQMVKMIPILVSTFLPSTMIAQVPTLFVKQGTTLDRSIGPNFDIPPACLTAFVTIFMLISIVIYDRWLVPFIRKYTRNPRGITMLQRIGIGIVLQIIVMVCACLAEKERLRVARENGIFEKNQTVPLTIFVLLPQFALMGVADTFAEVAKLEFFYDQAPPGMKSIGTSYFTTSLGAGSFLSSFLLSAVSDITKKHGKGGWIQNNLNVSHLDYFYALYAILSFINFLFFLLVARLYVYNADVDMTESKRELQIAMESTLPNEATSQDNEALLKGKG